MTPPVEVFSASELPQRVQGTVKGRRRKGGVELGECERLEMVQWACRLEERGEGPAVIVCEPLVRAFRRSVSLGFLGVELGTEVGSDAL